MGQVGNADGPHLHFASWWTADATAPDREQKQPALFSGKVSTSEPVMPWNADDVAAKIKGTFKAESCGILRTYHAWESTNVPAS